MTPHYPYLQSCEKGLVLHLGDGGRWIEVIPQIGDHFLSHHNCDSFKDRAAALNVGADALEFLDPDIDAPKILVEDGNYIMKYPLPAGVSRIENEYFAEPNFGALYQSAGLDINISYSDDGPQIITNSQGVIKIEDGVCVGTGFKGWKASHASWVIATLMSLSKPK